MKTYHDVAVVNASTGMSNVITLSNGAFNVPGNVAIDTTNKGWGDAKKIYLPNIVSITKTSAAAGTYRKIRVYGVGTTPTAGVTYSLRVYQKTKDRADQNPLFDKTVKVTAVTGETDYTLYQKFFDAFYEISLSTDIAVTGSRPTNGNEYFYIEGQFGTAGLEIYDMGWEVSDTTILSVLGDGTNSSAAFAQVAGSEDLVNHYAPGYATSTHTYTTYEFKYYEPVENPPFGHLALKPKVGVVFVEDDEAAEFLAEYNTIFSGLKKPTAVSFAISAANPGVVTAAAHGLVTGDTIRVETCSAAAFSGGVLSVLGKVYSVTKTGDDTFTIPVDTSGWASDTFVGTYVTSNEYFAR